MLDAIKYVYAVYQEKSFTKAAKKLHITQPALSNIVKKVESTIGAPIFDRSTLPLTVTQEGKFYIKSLEQIMMIERNINSYFYDMQHLNTGHLSVGGSSFFCSFILPEMLGKFNARYPKVSVELIEGNIKALRTGLFDESLDLILETAIREDDPEFNVFLYKEETIILAIPSSHPINGNLTSFKMMPQDIDKVGIAQKTYIPVPLKCLQDMSFVLLKPGNDLYDRSIAVCKEANFVPKVAIQTDQILTAVNISATGIGATFVRPDVFKYMPIQDRFCFYYLDSHLAKRKIFFATKKGRYISKATNTFLEMAGAKSPRKN